MKKRMYVSIVAVILANVILGGCSQKEGYTIIQPNGVEKTQIDEPKDFAEIFEIEDYLSESYQPSSFTQEDIESETVQWICTSYALYTQISRKTLGYIGGFTPKEMEVDIMKYYIAMSLSESWGIVDRDTAIEKISWILNTGHREKYREYAGMMEENKMFGMTEAQLNESIKYYYEEKGKLRLVYYTYPDKGMHSIDAWDYCRALQVLGDCYLANYISLEECLDISLVVAKELQNQYENWEEVVNGYMYGYYYWSGDKEAAEGRYEDYMELLEMENSPYNIPYDVELKENWKNQGPVE